MNRMLRTIGSTMVALAAMTVCPAQAEAQVEQVPQVVQVDVVLTRLQGEKRVSAMPFVLMVNAPSRANGHASLRMGVDVPVGTSTSNVTQTTGAQGSNPRATATAKVATEFRNVGTDIDASVTRVDAANYTVGLNVRDSSLFTSDQTKIPNTMVDPAAFRTFSASNSLNMMDGQTRLFGVGTDKITGETIRIEVKLTVLK